MKSRRRKKKQASKRRGWYGGARTFTAAWRTIAVNLEVARRVDEEATYSVAVAAAGASAHDLHEALAQAHPAHLPKLLLAEQRRPASVRRSHVSDQVQETNS